MTTRSVLVLEVLSEPGTTVVTAIGEDESGAQVRFAGDHRPMNDLAYALAMGETDLYVEVEDWQILTRGL